MYSIPLVFWEGINFVYNIDVLSLLPGANPLRMRRDTADSIGSGRSSSSSSKQSSITSNTSVQQQQVRKQNNTYSLKYYYS